MNCILYFRLVFKQIMLTTILKIIFEKQQIFFPTFDLFLNEEQVCYFFAQRITLHHV